MSTFPFEEMIFTYKPEDENTTVLAAVPVDVASRPQTVDSVYNPEWVPSLLLSQNLMIIPRFGIELGI